MPFSGDRPEVDRGQVRQMLLDSLPPSSIRWDHQMRAALPQDDVTCEVSFQNGAHERFDLVVGADGARSPLRPLVLDAKPILRHSVRGIWDRRRRHGPPGHRTPCRTRLDVCSRRPQSPVCLPGRQCPHQGLRRAEGAEGLDRNRRPRSIIRWNNPAGLAAQIVGWSESLSRMIVKCGETITPRPIYALPVSHHWVDRPGVTHHGDAAHLMSPFTGEGAELAMRNAADLAAAPTHRTRLGHCGSTCRCGNA